MLAARVGEIEEALREGARREAELKLKLERGAEDAAAKEKAAAAAGLIADQQVELSDAYRLAAVGKADGALAFGGVAALAHALAAWRRAVAWLEGAAEAGGLGHRVPADRRPPLAPPESGRKATPPRGSRSPSPERRKSPTLAEELDAIVARRVRSPVRRAEWQSQLRAAAGGLTPRK